MSTAPDDYPVPCGRKRVMTLFLLPRNNEGRLLSPAEEKTYPMQRTTSLYYRVLAATTRGLLWSCQRQRTLWIRVSQWTHQFIYTDQSGSYV